jgi:hypothetical protein
MRWHDKNCFFDEPRYALRSIAAHVDNDHIYIIGPKKPKWFLDTKFCSFINFIGEHNNPQIFTECVLLAASLGKNLLWCTDDCFFLQDYERKPYTLYQSDITHSYDIFATSNQPYLIGKADAICRLRPFCEQIFDFSTHTPYLFNSNKLNILIKIFKNVSYLGNLENLYFNYFKLPSKLQKNEIVDSFNDLSLNPLFYYYKEYGPNKLDAIALKERFCKSMEWEND